jgi:hypothetical protein
LNYQAKEIKLKNDTTAIFRSPTKDDAAQMIEYLKNVCTETNNLTRDPQEAEIPI